MKKVFLALYLLNMAITGYSQNITIAVNDFTARSGYTEAELGNITELFAGFLLETKKFRVLTRNQWDAILKEYNFQFSGYVADAEIRQIGKALGASAVITGTLMKLGNSNILNISLLNVESGEMQSAARKTFNNLDELLGLMPALSDDITKMLPTPNYFIGKWQSTSHGKVLILEFKADRSIIVERYDAYTANYNYKEAFIYDEINHNGKGTGNYSYDSDKISVILNMSFQPESLSYKGYFGRNSVLTFTLPYTFTENNNKFYFPLNDDFRGFGFFNDMLHGLPGRYIGYYTTFIRLK